MSGSRRWIEELTRALKARAAELGFEACRIARAEPLDEEARRLEAWLRSGMHASMAWMERHFEVRVDPGRLLEGARSVICLLHSYYVPVEPDRRPEVGRIARYAWGEDYHEVLKEKLWALFAFLEERVPGVRGRAFVDSGPVLEKAWAVRSGLGWQGKNSNVLHPRLGSYFFLGELIVDIELAYDGPIPDHCGRCTRCIEACPTEAIVAPYVVDSRRCISYWTIEHRGEEIDPEVARRMGNWIFGCDICQEVCPWNKFARATGEARFLPRPGMTDTPLEVWEELNLEAFRRRFSRSAVKRAKFEGFLRNVRAALRNLGRRQEGKA